VKNRNNSKVAITRYSGENRESQEIVEEIPIKSLKPVCGEYGVTGKCDLIIAHLERDATEIKPYLVQELNEEWIGRPVKQIGYGIPNPGYKYSISKAKISGINDDRGMIEVTPLYVEQGDSGGPLLDIKSGYLLGDLSLLDKVKNQASYARIDIHLEFIEGELSDEVIRDKKKKPFSVLFESNLQRLQSSYLYSLYQRHNIKT
jgi:hypothetical protein